MKVLVDIPEGKEIEEGKVLMGVQEGKEMEEEKVLMHTHCL